MLKKFKPWEDLTFTDDYMFKLLMERKRICKGTLNAFLDWNIRSITYFARRIHVSPSPTKPRSSSSVAKNARSGLSPRACALLDYMNGKITKEPLIAQIEESMRTIKRHETERKIYMTYIMKMREERQDAFTEGKAEGKAEGMNLVMRIVEQLQKKVPYQTIATDTHTTLEQVVEIANKFKMAY